MTKRHSDLRLYRNPFVGSRAAGFLLLWFAVMWPLPQDADWWLLAMKIVLLGAAMFLILWPLRRHGAMRSLERLLADLPTQGAWPTLTLDRHACPDLAATAQRHGFTLHELDGARIASWDDLANALQEQFGQHRFAGNGQRRTLSILGKLSWGRDRRRVLLWKDAAATLRRNPSLLLEVTSVWSSTATMAPVGLLLLVDLPQHRAAAENAPHESAGTMRITPRAIDEDAQTRKAALAAAPDDAWWKPKPGELTR